MDIQTAAELIAGILDSNKDCIQATHPNWNNGTEEMIVWVYGDLITIERQAIDDIEEYTGFVLKEINFTEHQETERTELVFQFRRKKEQSTQQ